MGLLKNDKDWNMVGYIDMTLEDANHHPLLTKFILVIYTYKKAWSQFCYSLHELRLSHCPTSRNEQRRKPHASVNI